MWSVRSDDGTVGTGWALMPLRLFLGVTFLYAGCQKLADPQFFDTTNPFGIHAQLASAAHSSPIHGLVSHLVPVASGIGLVIALGEVAIGLGILVGLWVRVAAVAGMALSLGLFLTVSFHSSPYFTGSDIVFFFAWTPLVLAGAAGAPALDTWIAGRRSAPGTEGGAAPGTAPVHGLPRRDVLSKGALTGIAAAVVLIGSGVVAALGRAVGGTTAAGTAPPTPAGGTTTTSPSSTVAGPPTTGATPTTTAPAAPSGTLLGKASSVPVA